MKVIFFGLGSIGRRHAGILSKMPGYDLLAFRSKEGSGPGIPGIREVRTWDEVLREKPDIAFITNPTFMHIETAIKCAQLDMKLFIEKPIDCSADKLDILISEVEKRGLVSYVAYNLRFHPVIEHLKEYLRPKKIRHASVYNSSFLPEWRPGTDHMVSYSASKGRGGGAVLDLSHEFDYIEHLFGDIEDISGIIGKASDVTLDAEDFVDAVVKTDTIYINLHMDLFSRHIERTIRIDCDDEYIQADLIERKIGFHTARGVSVKKFDLDRDDTYRKQMEYFLRNINDRKMENNLRDAGELFRKIVKFREACA